MRKVLSFVLVLSLVLGSFSMAFAATPASTGLSDIEGIANEDAIQVNYDLGIVTGNPDGTFLPEKAVNRAEFAAMITRALGVPESALAGYSTTSFKDTVGYGWAVPYLAFCQSKGIMLGDGAGNVMPGRTINTNEAVTMALRAVGYTANSAELVGTWPSNYVTKAQDLGLYEDVAKVVNVDKANAAQIIYNTLTVQKVAVNSDGETKFLWEGGVANVGSTNQITLLTSGLGCEKTDDYTVDGTEDSLININKYLGFNGTKYTNDDDEVVAFISKSTQLIGKVDSTDVFKTTVGEVEYTTTTGIVAAYAGSVELVNGKSGSVTSTDELVLNVKLSGKKIVEVYSVLEWTVTNDDKVSASDLKDITEDQSLLGSDFVLDDDDEIDYNSFTLVGAKSLSDIKADDVVYVYANSDGISKIEVGSAKAEGTVESFKSDTKFTIAGKTYKNATVMVNGVSAATAIDADDVSDDVVAYLDVNGYVYDFEAQNGGAKNIAVIEKQADGISDQVKIFTSEGKSSVHTYDSAELHVGTGTASTGAIIGYGLNKDGKITSTNENWASAALNFKSNSVVKVGTTDRVLASDVVVFTVDADGDYAVTTIDKVNKAEPILAASGAAVLYKSATDFKVIGVVVPAAQAKASSDDVFAVVNELYTATLDGDKVDRIVGYADGAKIDKKADAKYFNNSYAITTPSYATNGGVATLGGVQLFKIEMDADGIIVDVAFAEVGPNCSKTTASGATVTAADGRNSVTVTGGEILPFAKDVVVYEITDDDEYSAYTGGFKAGDVIVAYELDDDTDGYEVVFFTRAYR